MWNYFRACISYLSISATIENNNRLCSTLNRESVINKFIDKAGPLDPHPEKGFIMGTKHSDWGLTTDLTKCYHNMIMRYKNDYGELPKYSLSSTNPNQVVLGIKVEHKGFMYFWEQDQMIDCMRILENMPFKHIIVSQFINEPIPIAFSRKDCDISILMAPHKLPIASYLEMVVRKERPKIDWQGRPKFTWINQMPNSTFWLVEFPTETNSFTADLYGYPIGRMLKCRNCGNESVIQDWLNRKIRQNHPECMCSCNTYDDFCGCMRNRKNAMYDRMWREAKQAYRWKKKEDV